MAGYVALLYSIVIGGGRRLVMTDLKALAAEIGFDNPRTIAATGNLLFESRSAPVGKLEARLEPAFASRFGRHVDIIVRTGDDIRRIASANPFQNEAQDDPAHVIARIGRQPVEPRAAEELAAVAVEGERLAVGEGALWLWLPHGVARSRLAAAVTPRRFGVGTARNWNTLRRIVKAIQ